MGMYVCRGPYIHSLLHLRIVFKKERKTTVDANVSCLRIHDKNHAFLDFCRFFFSFLDFRNSHTRDMCMITLKISHNLYWQNM